MYKDSSMAFKAKKGVCLGRRQSFGSQVAFTNQYTDLIAVQFRKLPFCLLVVCIGLFIVCNDRIDRNVCPCPVVYTDKTTRSIS